MKRINDICNPTFAKKLRKDFLGNGFIFFPNFLNEEEIALGFIYYANKAQEDIAAHELYANKIARDLVNQDKI